MRKELRWFFAFFVLPMVLLISIDLAFSSSPLPLWRRVTSLEDTCSYGVCFHRAGDSLSGVARDTALGDHASETAGGERTMSSRATHAFGTAARGVVTFLAAALALYAISYLLLREKVFPPNLADSFRARPWGIYPHALFGGIALALGSIQFWRNLPFSHPSLHRTLGKIYVVAALITGSAGFYMSFFAHGGAVTRLGFAL